MRQFFPLCLLTLAFLIYSQEAKGFDRAADSLQLVILYNSTDGANWSETWNLANPMNTWKGVTLDATTGEVIALSLLSNNLRGALPNLILPKLKQLALRNNNLRDLLPSLGAMPSLVFVDLGNNQLDGPLFDFNLPNLETINLSNNKLVGSLPNFSKMPKTRTISLDNNLLDGGLPDFNMMPNLINLRLADNFLDGPIPEFNFLPQLLVLDLHGNRFFGPAKAFRGSPDLFFIDLSENNLTGFIPSFSRLLQLETLRLNDNQLGGTIGTLLSPLRQLMEVDLSNNQLEGPVPDVRVNTRLNDFNVSGNNLSGAIPSFAGLEELQRLDLSDNALGDTLPDFSYLPALVELRVDSNDFIHSNFVASSAPSLQVLEVDQNRFTFSDISTINGLGLTRFIYGPQKPIVLPDTIMSTLGADVIIDLIEDFNVPNNTYEWYHNDMSLVFTAVNELRLNNINALDEGLYYARVRNNSFPGLAVLFSEQTRLIMDCPVNEVTIVDSICIGDTLFVNGKPYTETGEYRDTVLVPDPATCDSIFIISLAVYPVYDTTLTDTICESDQVVFGGGVITDSGFYSDTLTSVHGCDSVVNLNLLVRPSFRRLVVTEICQGDTLQVGPFAHTETGLYDDTLQTIYGCDSVIIVDLTVRDSFLSLTEVDLCFGDTFAFRGVTYREGGTYVDRFTNIDGCDSLYVLQLNMPSSDRYPISRVICSGDSVLVGDSVYRTPGFYQDSLVTALGCDSIVELSLTMVENFNVDLDFTICDGDTLFYGGDTLTVTGIYIDSLVARGGCDSILKIRLDVVDFIGESLDTLLCFGDSLQISNNIYKVDGVFRDTIIADGCDTVLVSRIEVNPQIALQSVRTTLGSDNIGQISPVIVGGSGNFVYSWNAGADTRVIDSIPAGDYVLTVIDEVGCSASFDFTLDPSTGINESLNNQLQVTIFPNPVRSSSLIRIDLAQLEKGRYIFELIDLHGRIISRKELIKSSDSAFLDLESPAQSGMFFLKVWDEQGNHTSRRVMVHY
jgi:Leucine-rich repeat (LRR) protein